MNWMFLLVVCMALCAFSVIIGVMVMVIRAASKASQHPSAGGSGVPPILPDDSLTNPANPLYQLHHPSTASGDPSRHFSTDPSPSPSFDSGSSSNPSFDAGSSPPSSDSGSGCG